MNYIKKNVPVPVAADAGTKSSSFTGNRDGLTLFDRVVINNFTITSITCEEGLVNSGFLKKDPRCNACYADGVRFSRLDIKGDSPRLPYSAPFRRFFYGVSEEGYIYCLMEMNVDHGDGTYNLFGNTQREVINQVHECQEYLSMIGIEADFSLMQYKEIEENRTVSTPLVFKEQRFQSIGRSIYDNFPGTRRLNTESVFRKRKKPLETFNATSIGHNGKGIIVKLYDKSSMLMNKYKIDTGKQYTRFEITLKGADKIRKAFGTNYVREITDEMIDVHYTNWVNENVVQPQDKRIKNTQPKLRRMIKTFFRESPHKWADKLIQWILNKEAEDLAPLILDRKELIDAIMSLDRAEFKDRNRKRHMIEAMNRALDDSRVNLNLGKRSMQDWNDFIMLLVTPHAIDDETKPEKENDVLVFQEESEQEEKNEKADEQRAEEDISAENGDDHGLMVNNVANENLKSGYQDTNTDGTLP